MIHTPSHPSTWSRRRALIGAGVLGLAASLGRIPAAATARQGATGNVMLGVATEVLSQGDCTTVDGKSLALMRLTIHPGTAIASPAQSGPVALYVETGALDIEIQDGHGRVERAQVDGMSQGRKAMTAGDATRISAGDHLFCDGAVHHAKRW